MSKRIDLAKFYYWRVELVEPDDPDDNRYIMLYGDEGEIVGPMTLQLAQAWLDCFDGWRAMAGNRVRQFNE